MPKAKLSGTVFLLAAGVGFGAGPLFITWLTQSGVTPWLQLGARLAISVLVLAAAIMPLTRAPFRVTGRRRILFLALNGTLLLGALGTYLFTIALGTAPTKAVLLSGLSPIYASVAGSIMLGERLSRRKTLALALGLCGLAFTLRIWEGPGLFELRPSDLLAVLNGLLYAATIVVSRWSGLAEQVDPLTWVFWSFVIALGWLTLLALVSFAHVGAPSVLSHIPDNVTWEITLWLVGLSVISAVLPFTLIYKGLEATEAGTASILLLSEPVSVFVLSRIFLGDPIGWWQAVGGVLILGAGVLVGR